MTSYFDKRKKQKLYQQWVEKSGLPPENVPGFIDQEQEDDAYDDKEVKSENLRLDIQSGLSFRLTMRHLLYLVLITAVLLITTATLATILIMRSC